MVCAGETGKDTCQVSSSIAGAYSGTLEKKKYILFVFVLFFLTINYFGTGNIWGLLKTF